MVSAKLTKAQLQRMENLLAKRRQVQVRQRLAELRERERRERMFESIYLPTTSARKARLEAMRRSREIARMLAAMRRAASTRPSGKGAGMGLMKKAN